MTQYSLNFINLSLNPGSVCIYQTHPETGVQSVLPIAWLTRHVYPTGQVSFDWNDKYSFVWAETGYLAPGVKFFANQIWSADLSEQNMVSLSYTNSAYTFENLRQGPVAGSLYVDQDDSLPLNLASIGIGMSGRSTYAVQAQPNMHLIFTPKPNYWITFGNFREGEVLDLRTITNYKKVTYSNNINSMTAILNEDNTWTIQPTVVAMQQLQNYKLSSLMLSTISSQRLGLNG